MGRLQLMADAHGICRTAAVSVLEGSICLGTCLSCKAAAHGLLMASAALLMTSLLIYSFRLAGLGFAATPPS
jgi:hypothetical protein